MPVIPHDERLDGWKVIANFLGRERTTAIRWANERAMPVHRVPGGRTGTVYALRAELDAWLASDRSHAADVADTAAAPAAAPDAAPAPEPAAAPEAPAAPAAPAAPRLRARTRAALAAAGVAAGLAVAVAMLGRGSADPAVSVAAVASPDAGRETVEFARGLNGDLARFANASPDLAVFEGEPGTAPATHYMVRTEIERADGRMIARARLIAGQRGQVVWSRRFEQSGPVLSELRERVAAVLVDVLRCSFGGLDAERSQVRPADLEQLMAICENFEEHDLAAAETRARQLSLVHPDLSVGWALLAMIEGERVGEGDAAARAQALADSRRAMAIAPDGINTWLARVAASVGGPTSPEALPVTDAALRAHPGDPWLLNNRSVILFNLGYVAASVADALAAVRNDPSSLGSRDIAVRRLAAAGRSAEAAALQTENERFWPGHPLVVDNRALLAAGGARHADADATDADATGDAREFAATPYVAYHLARRSERAGDRRAALAWLARAPLAPSPQQWSTLFWPDAAGLRTEPAFFRKMTDLGLARWWRVRRQWPDFCSEPGLKYSCADEARKLHVAA